LLFFVFFILMSENPEQVVDVSYSDFIAYVDGTYYLPGRGDARLVKAEEQKTTFHVLKDNQQVVLPQNLSDFKPSKKIEKVKFRNEKKIQGIYKDYRMDTAKNKNNEIKFVTHLPMADPSLLKRLGDQGIEVGAQDEESGNTFLNIVYSALPYILLFGLIWFFFFRQVQSSNNRAFTFVKSKAKLYNTGGKKVAFKDVAGVEEAKEELKEIVDFLKEPQKFLKMGARIPKGVLLVGPPGTGKTMLARAVAGEADRPFYSISGSEFVEMFVGVGASRVRDLFETAKKNAPCIVFIDELDAVGRQRGAGLGGGNDEREQTLNQILVEMDGFENKETIIVIAATNRPDILDPALLRPGRFDRQVVVDRPDIKGREAILVIHTQSKPLLPDVDLRKIARGTPGFSGADLENMVNEAILIAARQGKDKVNMQDFEEARDKILMGPERKSMAMNEDEKRNTAFHEAGHAIVAHLLPYTDPMHKLTIIPRGRALGLSQQLPEQDQWSYTKKKLLNNIAILLGGRVAEEYKFGKDSITTGASNDLQRATELARSMVCKWGMTDKMGPLAYGKDDSPIFIGKEMGRYKDYSEETAHAIDVEMKKIVEEQYQVAQSIIHGNKESLEQMVKELLEKETLHLEDINRIIGLKPKAS